MGAEIVAIAVTPTFAQMAFDAERWSDLSDREAVLDGIRHWLVSNASTNPLLVIIEDLHWADSGLLDFIDHVLEWTRDQPIYIVTLARPELLEKRPNWGAGKRQYTSIFLEPLPEQAMRELLSGLISGLPEQAMRAIVDRADGVPLYAVEVVRILADGPGAGDVARRAERRTARRPRKPPAIAVPDTLHGVIAARIDSLPVAQRRLLLSAAVLVGVGAALPPAFGRGVDRATDARLCGVLRRTQSED